MLFISRFVFNKVNNKEGDIMAIAKIVLVPKRGEESVKYI